MATSLHNSIVRHLRMLFITITLFAFGAAKAQGPVPGYDYLTSCGTHHYYISQNVFHGNQIADVVNDFRSKVAVPANQVYAAAIVNAAENACITNAVLTYNMSKYGGNGKSTFENWGDPRNPWIGLSDLGSEGTFSWINGQPNCEDYRNWNVGEPNNYTGTVSNGEDFTQMLIMNPYSYNGNMHDPLGKWNDWFNQDIMDPNGNNLGPTRLPVIIEVGPADCPSPRGNSGCSHGYWKSGAKWWKGSVGVGSAGYKRTDNFFTAFNFPLPPARNTRGLSGSLSLDGALNLGGGGYNNVARQGVAALLNAAHNGVAFPYTEAEIKNAVRSVFQTGSAQLPDPATNYTTMKTYDANSLGAELDRVNNLGCPLNAQGQVSNPSSRQIGGELQPSELIEKQFNISGYPNPSRNAFTLQIDGLSTEKMSIRVIDMSGRLIEQRTNVAPNQVLTIGGQYKAGLYYIEVMQGDQKKQLKLIKQ